MKIQRGVTDKAILKELGERVEHARLQRNLTQDELASLADISRPTLQRLEAGASAQMTTFVRVLRALELLAGLDLVAPQVQPSPIEQLDIRGGRRKRASRNQRPAAKSGFKWGDET
ncbi:helix-turn-helix domain-containing protein [Phenylobacterium koreense]|uniref:Transcriptional regulator with XRE-family HTH domain n=1 Tax=Phenylobacterium koreense TaxID=266125 RepID=A0ABV2EMA8_9CAUL